MKLNRALGLLVVAAATVGAGSAVATAAATNAATATTTSAAAAGAAGKHWHRGHGGMLVGMMLHATRQLNLTTEQQASIKEILGTARSQHRAEDAATSMDMTVLGNPGDPNYATALQNAKAKFENRMQEEAALQGQIYNVLTAEQKKRLPQVLAEMQTKAQSRRAAWQEQHAAGAEPAAGSN